VRPQIVIGRTNQGLPFKVDARVLEEDTYLILSAEPRPKPARQKPRALLREAMKTLPKEPGSVLLRSRPEEEPELLAVVHDLELEPSCKDEWVIQALKQIFAAATVHDFRNITLPALGSYQDALPVRRFAELLRDVITSHHADDVSRIWLELRPEIEPSELAALELWITKSDT
jgi:hypothetical protein